MEIDKKEIGHQIKVLQLAKKALTRKQSLALKELSNETTHLSCTHQNPGSIQITVVLYILSKMIERKDYLKIKNWPAFVRKINFLFDQTIFQLRDSNQPGYEAKLFEVRQILEKVSPDLKKEMKYIVSNACVNKGSKIYEHGISLGRAAKLLKLSKWELSGYTGHRAIHESPLNRTVSVKARAKMALEFFKK